MKVNINSKIGISTIICTICVNLASLAAPSLNLKIDPNPISDGHVLRSSFAKAIERAAPSVVYVYTTKRVRIERPFFPFFDDPFFRRFFGLPEIPSQPLEREEHGLGSGVIVTEDGYILTNNHVIEGADEIEVRTGEKSYKAKVIGTDPATDVAILKVEATGLPAITLTDSDNLKVGDIVLAIGNPFGLDRTVTMGIVSALGRTARITRYESFIQTDAAINPGNSGGALVDVEGRLVGINTAIYTRTGGYMGIGFAIPINIARSVLESIVQHGKVVRGYLGVRIQPLTPDLAKAFGIDSTQGALVAQVEKGSPAEKAGLREGDIIIAVDGKKVDGPENLSLLIAQSSPGTEVELTIIRDGKQRKFRATLAEMPTSIASAEGGFQGTDFLEGVTIDNLTARLRRAYGIPANIEGVVVVDVAPTSLAGQAGLREGDVIISINRKPIRNVDEALEVIRSSEGDRLLLRVWSQGIVRFIVISRPQK